MPTVEQLITLAQLGGFVFASVVLLLALRALFDVLKSGTLISREQHDAVVAILTEQNNQLRTDLRTSASETGRLAEAVEKMGDTLIAHDRDMRERVAVLGSRRGGG